MQHVNVPIIDKGKIYHEMRKLHLTKKESQPHHSKQCPRKNADCMFYFFCFWRSPDGCVGALFIDGGIYLCHPVFVCHCRFICRKQNQYYHCLYHTCATFFLLFLLRFGKFSMDFPTSCGDISQYCEKNIVHFTVIFL